MKRWLGLLALLVVLSGCTAKGDTTIDPNATGANGIPLPNQGQGLYDPEHTIETQTGGAIKAYLLGARDSQAFAAMGNDFLLFGKDRLTLLTGENLTEVTTITAPNLPMPGSGMVQVSTEGVAYYNSKSCAVVFVGRNLREYGRLQLSETPTGGAYLTPDWKMLYYCTGEGIRVLDLETGICRTVKAQQTTSQSITGGFLDGTVLRCRMTLTDGTERTIAVSAQTGETLAEGVYLDDLVCAGQQYFMPKQAGTMTEWIFGQGTGQSQNFWPANTENVVPLPESNGAVTVVSMEGGSRLDYYDLTTGKRTASVELPDMTNGKVLTSGKGMVWFSCGGILYRWELALSKIKDEAGYIAPRYTLRDPDEEGLAAFEIRAQALERTYGVEILYWNEVSELAPWDYSFEIEYLTQSYEIGFAGLEAAMAKFPEDFFRKAADRTGSGILRIVLVRGIYGPQEQGTLRPAAGIQYLLDGESYIALSVGTELEQNFYHELGHVIDTKVLSSCSVFYEWNNLNPSGFRYDNDYIANQDRQDGQYLEGENRYFIDMYSMSFPVEDRSRIFEYACMPGNESYFTSQYMQAKLQRVCRGIREAFDLPEGTYIWEQYLVD